MAESPCKTQQIDSAPEVTIGLLSGATLWGPRRVDLGQTARELAACLVRPIGCPGVELVHGTEVLGADVDVSNLPDPTRLSANFLPPLPFDHSFVTELLSLDGIMDECMVLPLSQLRPESFKVPRAEMLRVEFIKEGRSDVELRLRLRLPKDSAVLSSHGTGGEKPTKLEGATMEWNGEHLELKPLNGRDGRIIDSEPLAIVVEFDATVDFEDTYELSELVVWSPVDGLIEHHARKRVFEGVSCSLGEVSAVSMQRLNCLIDELKASEPADYHPGSNDIVRDLVHPSLYPFINGVSSVYPELSPGELKVVEEAMSTSEAKRDMWSRPYEESKFQWLPAEVSVSAQGKCEFQTYINNVPKDKHPELYTALGDLLSQCLPHLEAAWSHGSSIEFLGDDADVYDIGSDAEDGEVQEKSLRGRGLQVIVKIVDYELEPDQTHEGVWHVEGMSHENIVATAELVLQRPGSLKGGDLEFQRAWTTVEAGRFGGLPQCRAEPLEQCIQRGLCPLGRLPLELGQLTAWPNCHVHKLAPLQNNGDKTAQRRVVVFWLVNPDRRIVSSRHVPPQQGSMSSEEAKKVRLELMEERKRHKQDWNIREVSLCEH